MYSTCSKIKTYLSPTSFSRCPGYSCINLALVLRHFMPSAQVLVKTRRLEETSRYWTSQQRTRRLWQTKRTPVYFAGLRAVSMYVNEMPRHVEQRLAADRTHQLLPEMFPSFQYLSRLSYFLLTIADERFLLSIVTGRLLVKFSSWRFLFTLFSSWPLLFSALTGHFVVINIWNRLSTILKLHYQHDYRHVIMNAQCIHECIVHTWMHSAYMNDYIHTHMYACARHAHATRAHAHTHTQTIYG